MTEAENSKDRKALEEALKVAHIPSLMMVLVHLTGDASHLKTAPKLVYEIMGDGQGSLPESYRAEIRKKVADAMEAHWAGKPLTANPGEATVQQMMDVITAAPIPPHYIPFLKEELAMDNPDPKR